MAASGGEVTLTLRTPTGSWELVEDTGRRYQRKAKKEKKRQKKLDSSGGGGGGGGGDDGDGGSSSDSGGSEVEMDEEQVVGCVEAPLMTVELVAGPCRGRSYAFGAEGLSIGASSQCGLAMASDWTVSSLHVRINHADGAWYLSDCGSAGGTFLLLPDAGMRVDAGDLVRIGKTEIIFLMQRAGDT